MKILTHVTHKCLVPSYELHESTFLFVSHIEFTRSKLSIFSAHVSGDSVTTRDSGVQRTRDVCTYVVRR